jgi:hypothetical protein
VYSAFVILDSSGLSGSSEYVAYITLSVHEGARFLLMIMLGLSSGTHNKVLPVTINLAIQVFVAALELPELALLQAYKDRAFPALVHWSMFSVDTMCHGKSDARSWSYSLISSRFSKGSRMAAKSPFFAALACG